MHRTVGSIGRQVGGNTIYCGELVLISDIASDATGELFLQVNDAVLNLPGLTDVFYRNSGGTAKVAVARISATAVLGHARYRLSIIHRQPRPYDATGAALLVSRPAPATTMRSATPNDPIAIVNAIYRGTIEGYDRQRALWLDPSNRRGTLSKALIALWARADAKTQPGDSGPIDFDVTTNSQGMEVKSFTAKTERQDEKRATIVATLTPKGEWRRNSPEDNTVRYDFIREGGRWVIDDVRSTTDGKGWSLKNLLMQTLKS